MEFETKGFQEKSKSNPEYKDDHKSDTCENQFSTTQDLKLHKVVHDDLVKLSCTFCDYVTTDKELLNDHMQAHDGPLKSKCAISDSVVSVSDILKPLSPNQEENLETSSLSCTLQNAKISIADAVHQSSSTSSTHKPIEKGTGDTQKRSLVTSPSAPFTIRTKTYSISKKKKKSQMCNNREDLPINIKKKQTQIDEQGQSSCKDAEVLSSPSTTKPLPLEENKYLSPITSHPQTKFEGSVYIAETTSSEYAEQDQQSNCSTSPTNQPYSGVAETTFRPRKKIRLDRTSDAENCSPCLPDSTPKQENMFIPYSTRVLTFNALRKKTPPLRKCPHCSHWSIDKEELSSHINRHSKKKETWFNNKKSNYEGVQTILRPKRNTLTESFLEIM